MAKFGQKSLLQLRTCHPDLVEILNEAIKYFDFSILDGHRDKITQNALMKAGKSKLEYPKSRHNQIPSLAVDIVPYPVDWTDSRRFAVLAGIIYGIAWRKGIKIRWGGNWSRDMVNGFRKNNFDDLPHFEISTD